MSNNKGQGFVSWGGHGTGTFGGKPRGLAAHAVHHPINQPEHGANDIGAPPIAPEWLPAAAMSRLYNEDGVDERSIMIRREGRQLALHGLVKDDETQELIVSLVRGTPGVARVIDYLQTRDDVAA